MRTDLVLWIFRPQVAYIHFCFTLRLHTVNLKEMWSGKDPFFLSTEIPNLYAWEKACYEC